MKLMPLISSPTFKTSRRSFALLLGVIATCFLTSCAFLEPQTDPTKFYVLTTPKPTLRAAPAGRFVRYRIDLRSIETPDYLHSKLMVVRTGANEIHFAEFDRWAEPLDEGIGRVLKAALSTADNVGSVTLDSPGDDGVDNEIKIQVLACEGVREESGTGSIRLGLAWEIQPAGTNKMAVKRGGFAAEPAAWDGKD